MTRDCTRRSFEKVRVVSNLYAGGGSYCITVVPEAAAHTRPLPSAGCFYMLSLNDSSRMLPRPLSLYSFDTKTGETGFLYRPMGEGTKELSLYAAGDSLFLHGPLGRGFDIPSAVSAVNEAPLFIVAGGGIGLAPLNLAVREILERNPNSRIVFIAGGKDASIKEMIDFFRLPAEVELILCTDDGSAGKKGFVPDILAEYLRASGLISAAVPAVFMLYACGPNPMLEKLAAFSNEYGIPCQISLERRMACGSAACMGCSVKTCGGMKKVCADGPVFDAKLFKDIG